MPKNVGDIEWLGLEVTNDALAATLQVRSDQVNVIGNLYGGVAVAAAVVLMEEATGRQASWVTVQFAGTCQVGEVVGLRTTVSAAGHRTSQLRVVGSVGGRELFVAVGAVRTVPAPGSAAGAPSGVAPGVGDDPVRRGRWIPFPDVPGPDDCPVVTFTRPDRDDSGINQFSRMDLRAALGFDRPPADRLLLWCRPAGALHLSRAVLGWQADMVGMVLAKATGALGGTSLDNTTRFVAPADPVHAWVLAEIRALATEEGHGHGSVFLWSPAGELLAIGSQTCVLKRG